MIKKERTTANKVEAKGFFRGLDSTGILIEDEKTEEIETLSFEDLQVFKDKVVEFAFADVTKEEM